MSCQLLKRDRNDGLFLIQKLTEYPDDEFSCFLKENKEALKYHYYRWFEEVKELEPEEIVSEIVMAVYVESFKSSTIKNKGRIISKCLNFRRVDKIRHFTARKRTQALFYKDQFEVPNYEQKIDTRKAVAKLSKHEQVILNEVLVNEKEIKFVADKLGVSARTISRRLKVIKGKLSKSL